MTQKIERYNAGPVHARRVPNEIIHELIAEANRINRTMDFIVTEILKFWYEDLIASREKKKKAAMKAAGLDGVRVG